MRHINESLKNDCAIESGGLFYFPSQYWVNTFQQKIDVKGEGTKRNFLLQSIAAGNLIQVPN